MSYCKKLKHIALFDFDGTLTKNDTFITFGHFCNGALKLCISIIKTAPWLIGWKLGVISNSTAKERLFRELYRGMDYETFKKKGQEFSAIINQSVRNDTMKYLQWHKKQGHYIAIVSASITEWIEPWAKINGVNTVIATTPEVIEGKLTGRFSSPNCHGEEKVNRIKAELGDLNCCEIWGYGDSSGDDAMLAISTHPQKL